MNKTNEKQDRAFNLAAAIEKIAAYRVNESESVALASEYDLDVNRWAENFASTAIEYGKRAPRRAS